MKAGKGCGFWRPLAGVLAVGVLAYSIALEGAPTRKGSRPSADRATVERSVPPLTQKEEGQAPQKEKAGEKLQRVMDITGVEQDDGVVRTQITGRIPEGDLKIMPTVTVDYRNDPMSQLRREGKLVGPLPLRTRIVEDGANGFAVAGTGICSGGCTFTIDCEDDDPCTEDSCDFPLGNPPGSGTCVNTPVANGEPCTTQNGLFCDGQEVCQSGSCVDASDPDCTGQVCDEVQDSCVDPCTAGSCDDGIKCNGLETCSDGGVGNGICIPGDNPCGPGTRCLEGICDFPADVPCSRDADCSGATPTCVVENGPGCFSGRCCFEPGCENPDTGGTGAGGDACGNNGDCCSGSCVVGICRRCADFYRRTSAQGPNQDSGQFAGPQCEERGGFFYATDPGFSGASGAGCAFDGNQCPGYSGGVAPQGDFVSVIGPISDSCAPRVGTEPLNAVIDDYAFDDPNQLYELQKIRWVGGGARLFIEFYDLAGNFIDDTLPLVVFSNDIVVRVVEFSPPLVIPGAGFIRIRNATQFTPNGQVFLASTDTVDVGTDDPNILCINDQVILDGITTDCTNPLSASAAGVPEGTLAFEMVGDLAAEAPIGACCDSVDGMCDQELEWVCRRGTCSHDGTTPCFRSEDCGGGGSTCQVGVFFGVGLPCDRCEGGTNPGAECTNPGTEDNCGTGGLCISECDAGACCEPDGTCLPGVTESSCTGGGGTFLGFGTNCAPNCCFQPTVTGGDNCQDAIVQVITVPTTGQRVVTLTGDNTTASGEAPDGDSCFGVVESINDDAGWWEAFSIDDCAFVRVDLCCTEPIHEPAYRIIFGECAPCGPALFSVPNPNDPNTDQDAVRGAPYCVEDNLWAWYGPLLAGTYYVPIFSALGGHFGEYQVHITVEGCPEAACCVGGTCINFQNQIECEAQGGVFLGPPNRFPAVSTCVGDSKDCNLVTGDSCGTCQSGSCCAPETGTDTGPGACDDVGGGGKRMDADQCTSQFGDYVGGMRCKGGFCGVTNVSCSSTQDCLDVGVPGDCHGTGEGFDPQQLVAPSPCPLCDIAGPNNCQALTSLIVDFDFAEFTAGEQAIADDFVPQGNQITKACTSGWYLSFLPGDVDDTLGCRQRNAFAMPNPPDKFRIRVYEDGADDGNPDTPADLPGNLFAERFVSLGPDGGLWEAAGQLPDGRDEGISFRKENPTGPNSIFFGGELTDEDYILDFSFDPITGLDPTRRFWLEIINNMDEAPFFEGEPSCLWVVNHSESGNDFAAAGGAGSFLAQTATDVTFCLDVDFDPSQAPLGVCCTCANGVCTENQTLQECLLSQGEWTGGVANCGAITCNAGAPPNDTSATPTPVSDFGDPVAGTVVIRSSHFCAETSLPEVEVCTDFSPPAQCNAQCEGPGSAGDFVGQDVWYSLTTTTNGELDVNMCPTGTVWDSMFALYRNECVGGVCTFDDSTACGDGNPCPCPEITDVATCLDASFEGPDGATASDEGCARQAVGGPGITSRNVLANSCYLIQVGAWGPTASTPALGFTSVRVTPPSLEPPVEPCDNDFAAAANGAGGERLSRYACMKAATPPAAAGGGQQLAVQVGLKVMYNTSGGNPDTPLACPPTGRVGLNLPNLDQFEGQIRWLGEPKLLDDFAVPAQSDYIAVPLVCTAAQAHVRDWSADALAADFPSADPSKIYVYGPEIVPCSVYDLRFCSTPGDDSSCHPDPTPIQTSKLGDTWPPFAPVSGQPGFPDIGATVAKFKSFAFTPGDPPTGGPPEWHAAATGNVLAVTTAFDGKVGFIDIGRVVDSFKTRAYREMGPCDRDTGLDTCGNACSTTPGN